MTIPCDRRASKAEERPRRIGLAANRPLWFALLEALQPFGSLPTAAESFRQLVEEAGIATPTDDVERRRNWPLISDREAQNKVTNLIAGLYMGKTNKKGGTYDWPYKHLGDASGKVTPRSFIKLFVEASKYGQAPAGQVISAEGIRHGLREASKVRVGQLGVEYGWVKRALAPLAGLRVPCEKQAIFDRWSESNTIKIILDTATDPENGFLPPFPLPAKEENELGPTRRRHATHRPPVIREDGRCRHPRPFPCRRSYAQEGRNTPHSEGLENRIQTY